MKTFTFLSTLIMACFRNVWKLAAYRQWLRAKNFDVFYNLTYQIVRHQFDKLNCRSNIINRVMKSRMSSINGIISLRFSVKAEICLHILNSTLVVNSMEHLI